MNNPKIKISLEDLPAAYKKKQETLSLEPKKGQSIALPSEKVPLIKNLHPPLFDKNTVQYEFLSHCVKSGFFVDIFLVNGVKLQGTITKFDSYCLVLQNDKGKMLVMKSAISTIKDQENV